MDFSWCSYSTQCLIVDNDGSKNALSLKIKNELFNKIYIYIVSSLSFKVYHIILQINLTYLYIYTFESNDKSLYLENSSDF